MKKFILLSLLCAATLAMNAQNEAYVDLSKETTVSADKKKAGDFSETQKLLSSRAVREHIAKHLIYPEQMETNGIEGRVLLKFKVASSGKVMETSVEKATHVAFESAVKELFSDYPIRQLESFDSTYIVQVPVNFRL